MDYVQIYADYLKKHFDLSKPIKIVCDCSNGCAGIVVKKLTDIPNLEIVLINDTPDPDFPSHGPNPLAEGASKQIAEKIIETKADLGVMFDADADRAFMVDEKGEILPSFMTCFLLFRNHKPPYIAEELIYKSLQHIGGIDINSLIPSKVGSRFVKELLKKRKASTGGEFSGHYYFAEFFGVDSGIFAMIQVANSLSKIKEPLSVFRNSLPKHEMINEQLKLGDKKWEDIQPKVKAYAESKNLKIETREGLTFDTGSAWVNIRPSNTEPILRFIGGSANPEEVRAMIRDIEKLI